MVEPSGNIADTGADRHVEVTAASLESLLVSGGARVDGAGATDAFAVEVGGGARVDLSALVVQTMDVDVSAGAEVDVTVESGISGEVSGGAKLTVFGDPLRRDLDVSGGGQVG
jgi:hypothetical protein